MKVLKFGGTSVGSSQRIKNVAKLIAGRGQNIIVVSAMSGTTNELISISTLWEQGKLSEAKDVLEKLKVKYKIEIEDLLKNRTDVSNKIENIFLSIQSFLQENFTEKKAKIIVAQGEMISSLLLCTYLKENNVQAKLLPALDFMWLDINGEPDENKIKDNLLSTLKRIGSADLYITQGFITRDFNGEIDNLKRGGSDYTATLIGSAIDAEEIEIWTDIDGMHNNDPRYVNNTQPVPELNYAEAAELAYFGAKILHPTCVIPAKNKNIPIRLLNTLKPHLKGTLISQTQTPKQIKAIAAKDNITAIKIKSSRMLLAYGFLRQIFEIFERFQTSIDMIVTSEVAVSVTIDNTDNLDPIITELEKFGSVTVDRDMTIICIVGDLRWNNAVSLTNIINSFHNIPIRMISYGGSNHNISFLVNTKYKAEVLNILSKNIFI